jgi:uncharacterized membrane protein
MKSKLSLRKKVIIQIISPTLITLNIGIISMYGQNSLLSDIVIILAIGFYLLMLYYTYRKNCEPEDEMSMRSQQKADSLSFNITLVAVAGIMIYAFMVKKSVVFSITSLLFIFAGMNILNLIIFLYYDIRGN